MRLKFKMKKGLFNRFENSNSFNFSSKTADIVIFEHIYDTLSLTIRTIYRGNPDYVLLGLIFLVPQDLSFKGPSFPFF